MKKSILLVALLISDRLSAEPILRPDSISLLSGSYLGFVSLGQEKNFFKGELLQYSQDLRLGYVPRSLGGRELLSVSTRARLVFDVFEPFQEYTIRPYMGAGAIFALDEATFVILPKQYPRRYYPPTGLLFTPSLGVATKRGVHEVFFEVASLDKYIEYKSRNQRELSYRDIMTWGFGYRRYYE